MREALRTISIYKAVLVTPKVLSPTPTTPPQQVGLRLELCWHGASSETENTSKNWVEAWLMATPW